MRVTVLGCGPSTGVPVIGGNWGRCDPADRRNRRRRVSVLVEVGRRFGYVLKPVEEPGRYYKPTLIPHEIVGPFEIHGIGVVPFAQDHGFSTTLGIRIGPFAYSTDVTALDETAFAALEGVDLWIVDCLRRERHPTHSHLAKTLAWIARVKPRCAVLTHMDQSLDYRELATELPPGIEPGYDGLAIDVRNFP